MPTPKGNGFIAKRVEFGNILCIQIHFVLTFNVYSFSSKYNMNANKPFKYLMCEGNGRFFFLFL